MRIMGNYVSLGDSMIGTEWSSSIESGGERWPFIIKPYFYESCKNEITCVPRPVSGRLRTVSQKWMIWRRRCRITIREGNDCARAHALTKNLSGSDPEAVVL